MLKDVTVNLTLKEIREIIAAVNDEIHYLSWSCRANKMIPNYSYMQQEFCTQYWKLNPTSTFPERLAAFLKESENNTILLDKPVHHKEITMQRTDELEQLKRTMERYRSTCFT